MTSRIETPQPKGDRLVPFDALCYGAKFKYSESDAAVWVKVGHNTVAGWEERNVATKWVAQPLCLFCDDDNFSAPVWLLDDGAPAPAQCRTCNGTRVVDDGELTHSSGGIPYENGPIKCVKDCPECAEQPAVASAELRFEYAHPANGDRYTVRVSRDDVLGWASEELFERLTAMHCQCEPIGETNVVDCRCDEYTEEFELMKDGAPTTVSVPTTLPSRDELRDVIAEAVGGDAYDCIRVWDAWGVGTMSQDDFVPIIHDDNRLYEIADACLAKVKGGSQ